MTDPMDENRAILTAPFGEDWEMYLISQGIIGGTNDDEILADRERVFQLAKEKEEFLAEIDLDPARVADAWFAIWCDNHPDVEL